MQNLKKQITVITVMIMAIFVLPMQASNTSKSSETVSVINLKDDLIGGWEYTVAGAPQGFETGFMLIVKVEKTYKVQIQTAAGNYNATNVAVKGSKATFNLLVEGETVTVALEAKGSKMTGTSTSSAGVFNITGAKSISPQ